MQSAQPGVGRGRLEAEVQTSLQGRSLLPQPPSEILDLPLKKGTSFRGQQSTWSDAMNGLLRCHSASSSAFIFNDKLNIILLNAFSRLPLGVYMVIPY